MSPPLLEPGEFIEELERANRKRFDDTEWSFNDPQRKAVLHGEGPLHVTAGPGSGKTEVLICRALKLLLVDGVYPKSIVLTTFTEKAAQNLEERIADRLERLGYGDAVDVNELRTGTLHSLCGDIMQEYRYGDYANVELLDEDAQRLFMYDECAFTWVLSENGDPDNWETVDGAIQRCRTQKTIGTETSLPFSNSLTQTGSEKPHCHWADRVFEKGRIAVLIPYELGVAKTSPSAGVLIRRND